MPFSEQERAQALELIETLSWGDMDVFISGLETALALAIEATGAAIELWEEEGEERFGDEFSLSAEEVASLDDEWRLAYIARLLRTAIQAYGIYSDGAPGRNAEGETRPPAAWSEDGSSPARVLRGLLDLVHGVSGHA
jgi:hypothetical protein